MKKLFLLLFLMIFSLGQSQTLLQGFESAGSINGGPFGGMPAPVVEAGTGSNTSQVLKITTNTGGEPWQGINLFLNPSTNLTVNKTLTIDVLAFEPITFLVKVTTGGQIAAAPATHNGNGTWQKLFFTFNTALDGQVANPSGTYSGFVIHAYWEVGRTQFFTPTVTPKPARTFYVDNISEPPPPAPISGDVYINDNSLTGDVWSSAVGQNIGVATGTTSLPYKNLTDLFSDRVVAPGTTIHVDAGTYSGRVVFSDTEDGTAGNIIRIKGAGTGLTSLTSSLSGGSLISTNGADFMTFQDMTITGGNEANAILVNGTSTNCTFNNLNISNNNNGIRLEGGSNFATISKNIINSNNSGITDYGIFITSGASNGHTITNNMVSNFAHTFRSDNTGTINCNMYHNSFFANQYASVAYLTGWNVKNNIFHTTSNNSTHVAFWYGDPQSPATLDNNLYYHPNAAQAVLRFGPNITYATLAAFVAATIYEDNGVEGNPLFFNTAVGDLHLQTGSPAIGEGVDVGVTDDIDGDARPLSGTFDIGADEFDAGSFVPAPTLSNFTVPSQVQGNAPFVLTAPTSDSPGAFTYTISPAGIATISGDTVTIIGAGTATITATQAAVPDQFTDGSITAQLVVTIAAAPVPPPRNSFDVISFYSDSYANNAFNWIGSAFTPVVLGGNNARFVNDYTEAQFGFANRNVSQMTTLHIDIFSDNQTPTWIRLNGVQFVATTPVNGWTSLDIPLSSFPGAPLNAINNITVSNPRGAQTPRTDIYLDNVYFYRPETDIPPTLGAFTVPTGLNNGSAPFELVAPTSDSPGAWTFTSSNPLVATIDGTTVTIENGGTTTITATQAAVAGQFGAGIRTASLVVTFLPAGPSPIPAPRAAERVISIYTGDESIYATVPNYTVGQASWSTGSTTYTEVPNGTNTALLIGNVGFIGLVDVPAERRLNLSASGMSHMNIDIYVDQAYAAPGMIMNLLAPNDRNGRTGALNAGWNTVRVPLSDYGGVTSITNFYGLKIEDNLPNDLFRIYVDNFYFSNDLYPFYADADGDGFGAGDVVNLEAANASTPPAGYSVNNTDCDDTNELVWQSGDFYIDFDGDGYSFDETLYPVCYGAAVDSFYSVTSLGLDCNDFDVAVYQSSAFYADADGDGYSPTPLETITECHGATVPTIPGFSLAVNPAVDCDDTSAAINPAATEICWNNIDDNCNTIKSEGCIAIPVFVNNPVTITNFATHLSAVPYTYPGAASLDYRFEVTNISVTPNQTVTFTQTGVFARYFTIPVAIRGFNTTYAIRASAVINGEEVPYVVPVITAISTGIPTVKLSSTSCDASLSRLNATISANPGFNASSYEFRIRLTSDNGATPTYYYFQSPSRFIGANSFIGLSLQYNTSYSVSVRYATQSIGDASIAVISAYGDECTITTPSMPLIGLNAPLCGSTLTRLGATISASPAAYAQQYQFRVRLTSDNGPTPTYYTTVPSASRYSSLMAVQGLVLANNTQYSVSVRYSIPVAGGGTEFSAYGSECILVTPGAAPILRIEEASFKVVAYPNPFAESFQINVKSISNSIVNITVYDMIGRLIETRSVKASQLETTTIGGNYPSGVYNVIVSQNDELESVRIIKR